MIVSSDFKPLWWLKNPHLQTLWPVVSNWRQLQSRPERLELGDGDFLDLNWFDNKGPLVVVVHGLEGSLQSTYAKAMMTALQKNGFHGVFMHFRGCSGEPNRLDRAYHSGETGDIQTVINHVRKAAGKPVHAVIGYSLGGNALLKWLGERGENAPVERAVAVSIPFNLNDAARRLTQGLSRCYQRYLLHSLKKSYLRKFLNRPSPISVNLENLQTFRHFDHQITAPLHGFSGVDDYYQRSSSGQYLKNIRRNTLIIHSIDDPFMFPESIPDESLLSECVILELSRQGGHVGFISGKILPIRWLEQRVIRHLQNR